MNRFSRTCVFLAVLAPAVLVTVAALIPLAQAASPPLVNWSALQTAGLTGAGETVGITSEGINGLATAEADGLVPAGTVVTDPSYIGEDPTDPASYSHAVFSAIVVHMIAPQAKIVICNGTATAACSNSSDYDGIVGADGVNVIANNQDEGVDTFGFAYGTSYTDSQDVWPTVPFQNANPGVLFVMSGSDSYGQGYFQGQWMPATVTVGGQTLTVENFGLASGGASDPDETLANPLLPPDPVFLQAADANPSDSPGFTLYVYDANGNFVATSGSETGACSGFPPAYFTCVSIPAGAALPVKIYAALTSGTVTGTTWLKFYVGNGIFYASPYWGLSHVTAGSVTPSLMGAGPNAIVTGGATSATATFSGSSVGPLLGFDAATNTFNNFDYPTVTGDWCLTLPEAFDGSSEFCGNSNSAPEIAAVSALLLQAGLTPAEIENSIQTTSTNPTNPGQWNGTWGYGIMNPSAALEQYVTLPQPAIEQGSSESVRVNVPLDLVGLCNAPPGDTVTAYSWNFGNGATAGTADVNPSWSQAGIHTVTFNCTDSQNLSGATPATMSVNVTQPGGSSGGGGGLGPFALAFLALFWIGRPAGFRRRTHARRPVPIRRCG